MTDREQYTSQAVRAVLDAARREHDVAGWLAGVLASVAGQLGSSALLVAGRPGSWEASYVRQLLGGTAGWDDEYLPGPLEGITDMKAREIRNAALHGEGITRQEIADEFGVPLGTVNDIASGRTWSWLAEEDSR